MFLCTLHVPLHLVTCIKPRKTHQRTSEQDNVFLESQTCWLACTHMRPKAPPTGQLKMANGGFREPGQTIFYLPKAASSFVHSLVKCDITFGHMMQGREVSSEDWAWQCFPWRKKPACSTRAFTSPVSLHGPKAGPAGLSKKVRGVSEGKIYNIFFGKRGLGGHKRFGDSLQNSSNLDPHVHMSTCPWVCRFAGLQSACPLSNWTKQQKIAMKVRTFIETFPD